VVEADNGVGRPVARVCDPQFVIPYQRRRARGSAGLTGRPEDQLRRSGGARQRGGCKPQGLTIVGEEEERLHPLLPWIRLVGWSLDGLYAGGLAKVEPDKVRCVISLGSPFAGLPE